MAKTHSLLTNSRWEGASLRALVDEELSAHDIRGGCVITVRGEDVELAPKTALTMSMAVHELVTNAVKHGCLADAEGRLEIAWALEDCAGGRALVVRWNEFCSRQIEAPTRKGFGQLLLEKVFAREVGKGVDLRFERDGLKCQLTIPESRIVATRAPVPPVQQAQPLPASITGLSGLRVLVVEDGALIAEDLTEWLSAAGASVVGPCGTLREAAEASRTKIDIALLDVDVDGEPVWSLATDLRARGVPFILTTGFSTEIERPSEFLDSLIVNKPYDLSRLQLAISTSLGRPDERRS